MDYEKEFKKIESFEPKEYFKATSGLHEIVFLGEPTETSYNDNGKEVEQIEIPISVKEKVLYWTITKGQSFKSLYGQLVALGNAKGRLKEERITLLVSGEDKNKTYVVSEASRFIHNKSSSNTEGGKA